VYTSHDAGQIVDQTAPFARLTAQPAYPEVKIASRFKQWSRRTYVWNPKVTTAAPAYMPTRNTAQRGMSRILTSALPARIRPGNAQAATVLDPSRALSQGDGYTGPAFAGSAESGAGKLVILDAGDLLYDAFGVGCPSIDAEGEAHPRLIRLSHRQRLPQSSSASRFTAGAAGFLNLSHARERPEI